jgi:hypothetical protein
MFTAIIDRIAAVCAWAIPVLLAVLAFGMLASAFVHAAR